MFLPAAEFSVPAPDRYPAVTAGGATLPGGRNLKYYGSEFATGPSPARLALSPKGMLATADTGPDRFGITRIDPPGQGPWHTTHIWARTPNSLVPEVAPPDWKSVGPGLAFESEKALWLSEGASGYIRLIDPQTGDTRRRLNLASGPTGDLAYDPARRLLYALAGSSLAIVDARAARLRTTLPLPHRPAALALAPDGQVWLALADSITPVDLRDPIPTATPVSTLLAADGRLFASSPSTDEVLVVSPATRAVTRIPLRIPQLETLRGISPAGLAFDPLTKWLLVAETGINAVAVIDTTTATVLGHIPAGWMPSDVAIFRDRAYVSNLRGHGTGPYLQFPLRELGEPPTLHRGSVTTFVLPAASELAGLTATVLASGGFTPAPSPAPPMAASPAHVVLITTEGRSFDETLGDILRIGPTPVASVPALARFGLKGLASGASGQFSLHDVAVTPNLHQVARLGAFSDNYYAEAEPPQTEDLAPLLAHLERNHLTTARFDSPAPFLERLSARTSLPAFTAVNIPRPTALSGRFPWEASFAADADLTIGRILEALSHSPAWHDTVVLIAASSASTSLDHIDSHRTLFLAAGPSVKRTYLSRTNASFPAVVRCVLELLRAPPLSLRDAAAASLREMFTGPGNAATFTAIAPDPRLFQAP